MTLEVLATGPGTTVQDLGRVGHAAWGVGAGGAADRGSFRLANRLVGNPDGTAGFEVLLGGLQLRTTVGVTVAVTGAPVPVRVDDRPGRVDGPQWLPAGATLSLGAPLAGVRSYVAMRGGVDAPVILGSRSVDEASGLGRALRVGDTFAVGVQAGELPAVDQAVRRERRAEPLVLTGIAGPRDDWFTAEAIARFGTQTYVVEPASNRVGVRLAGAPLERRVHRELLSEPTVRGAVEVPADGQPIVFGADHPTTCGYPVIAVLDPDSADAVAQRRPGESVRFRLRPGFTCDGLSR